MTSAAADGSDADDHPRRFEIVVVCTANICRSPMAEHLLRGLLAPDRAVTDHPRFEVSSAGVRALDGAEMDPPAAAELRRLGGDPSGFRARSFTAKLGEQTDLILTATSDHRRMVLEEVPHALHRTFTLLELANLVSTVDALSAGAGDPAKTVQLAAAHRGAARIENYDVEDPYGRPAAAHRLTAERILAACRSIAVGLAPPTD